MIIIVTYKYLTEKLREFLFYKFRGLYTIYPEECFLGKIGIFSPKLRRAGYYFTLLSQEIVK